MLEVLAKDYTMLQIIYLSKYKTPIHTTVTSSPLAVSVTQSPEEMSNTLNLMGHLLGLEKKEPPVGDQEDGRREVG